MKCRYLHWYLELLDEVVGGQCRRVGWSQNPPWPWTSWCHSMLQYSVWHWSLSWHSAPSGSLAAHWPFTSYMDDFWQTRPAQHCASRWHVWPSATHPTHTPAYTHAHTHTQSVVTNNMLAIDTWAENKVPMSVPTSRVEHPIILDIFTLAYRSGAVSVFPVAGKIAAALG